MEQQDDQSDEFRKHLITNSRALMVYIQHDGYPSQWEDPQLLDLQTKLRASVTKYVAHLKAEHASPSTMLFLVKSAFREGCTSQVDPFTTRSLLAEVVRWSIDAYYRTDRESFTASEVNGSPP